MYLYVPEDPEITSKVTKIECLRSSLLSKLNTPDLPVVLQGTVSIYFTDCEFSGFSQFSIYLHFLGYYDEGRN